MFRAHIGDSMARFSLSVLVWFFYFLIDTARVVSAPSQDAAYFYSTSIQTAIIFIHFIGIQLHAT
jgi:hypothetical protein